MRKKWTESEAKTLKQLIKEGISDREIAKTLGRTLNSVQSKRLSEGILTGIHKRRMSEDSRKAIGDSKRLPIDHDIFDQWTQENAWALGLITADGSFSTSRSHDIYLYNTDFEMIEAVRSIFKTEKAFYLHKTTGRFGKKQVGRLILNSKKVIDFLKKINGYGDKNHRNPFSNVPDEFKWAFIKGLFDGDGNFYKGHMSIAGRKELITEVYTWICKQLNRNPNKIYQSTASELTVYFQLSRSDTRTVLDLLTEQTGETYNSFKFEKWRLYKPE